MPNHHQATPDEWAQQADWAQKQFSSSSCIIELLHRIEALEAIDHHPLVAAVRAQSKTVAHLGNRVERLEELHAAVVDLNQRFNLDPLVARIELLEATQYAQITGTASEERKAAAAAAEAGARRAVEHLSKPGSWQPLRAFTADEVAPIVVPTAEPAADAQQLTLVERVARRLANFASESLPGDDTLPIASDVLRDVARWLAEGSGRSGAWSSAAADLDNEANR